MTLVNIPIKWVIRLCIYGAIIYGVYFMTAAYANGLVNARGLEFCTNQAVGNAVASYIPLVLKPKQVLLTKGVLDGKSDEFVVRFVSQRPFKGYECRITTLNGVISALRYYDVE